MNSEYHIAGDANELAANASQLLATLIREAVTARGSCMLALSGGKTPRLMYEKLVQPAGECIPWQHVSLFWSDERFVPDWHADSNYRMAKDALLCHLTVQPAAVYPVDTNLPSAAAAAAAYENTIRDAFPAALVANGRPVFDAVLLGLGADGHTASLFPGDQAVNENTRWAAVGRAPDHSKRISLTLPVLNQARRVIFLVAGAEKAAVVAAIARGQGEQLPAAMVKAANITWLLDAAAASMLERS